MKERSMFITLFLAVLLLPSSDYTFAQSTPKEDLTDVRKAIAASDEIYFQAFVKNDRSILIDLYAEDCWIIPPDASALCGPDAPGDFFRTAYDQLGVRNGKFITVDVYGISEDIVAELGFWRSYGAGDIGIDDGGRQKN
ncbi:MAG: nuclear transport factor 2 family protein [Chitinophagaceae bacterium]|nr:nuclear transport factor 2 family protein [Chitinophagaceae bacterium]